MFSDNVLDRTSFLASSPLRLSIGGGGTDLPFYAEACGTDLTVVALSARVTVILGPIPLGNADSGSPVGDGAHPYTMSALAATGASPARAVASISRVPRGSGLGGSAAFATALIAACEASVGTRSTPAELAEAAWDLETNCGVYAGRQDPYATAHGGLLRLTCEPGCAAPTVGSVATPDGFLNELASWMRLYFTGVTRRSTDSVVPPTGPALRDRIGYLNEVKAIGRQLVEAIQTGKIDDVAALIAAHSALKRATSAASRWASAEALAHSHGAQATKLVGAGGGGFVLAVAEPDAHSSLDAAMAGAGLSSFPVAFSGVGTRCRAFDSDEWKN